MQSPLIKAIQAVQMLPIHSGNPPNPAILQVTMDTVAGTDPQMVISLTVEAARQLQEALAKTLLSLDSR
jgi:hypothetical protein